MEQQVAFEDIFNIIRNKIRVIFLWSLIGLLASSVYTFFIDTPLYESTSRIVVNQTQNTNQSITNTDIQTNLNLINTYQSIIKEPIILESVLDKIDSNISIGALKNKINIQTQANSLVFGITLQDESPYIASQLANAVATSFEEKIGDILEVQSVTILSEATPNMNPVSPNITMNLILGLAFGAMIGISLAFVIEIWDKRVKDNKIIEAIGWSNLGSILEMSTDEVTSTRIAKNKRSSKTSVTLSRRRV